MAEPADTARIRVQGLVEAVKEGMTLKYLDPPDEKTQTAVKALLELQHLADLRQKERAGWEIRTVTAEAHAKRLEEQYEVAIRERDEAVNGIIAQAAKRQDIELAELKEQFDAAQAALRAIKELPSDHDLMHNAVAKAAYTIADRALGSNPAKRPSDG
jgi:DNA repair exonuclease SbcCD ATPase subunit